MLGWGGTWEHARIMSHQEQADNRTRNKPPACKPEVLRSTLSRGKPRTCGRKLEATKTVFVASGPLEGGSRVLGRDSYSVAVPAKGFTRVARLTLRTGAEGPTVNKLNRRKSHAPVRRAARQPSRLRDRIANFRGRIRFVAVEAPKLLTRFIWGSGLEG